MALTNFVGLPYRHITRAINILLKKNKIQAKHRIEFDKPFNGLLEHFTLFIFVMLIVEIGWLLLFKLRANKY